MPYITQDRRDILDPAINAINEKIEIGNEGELNYVITRIAARWMLHQGKLAYAKVNATAGVLQKVLAEFDARVTLPYEVLKAHLNGDIPEYKEVLDTVTSQWMQAKKP